MMSRAEFMSRLTALLRDVPPAEREEAITYYNEYFDDAGEENEQGVIAALGSPEELAKSIKAGLSDGGNGGEFTESGFQSYEQRNENQVMLTNETRNGKQEAAQEGGGFQGNSGGAQTGTYGQQTGAYGQPGNGGGNAYGQSGNGGGNAYGQSGNGSGNAYGAYGQSGNGGGNAYGQSGNGGGNAYGAYGQPGNGGGNAHGAYSQQANAGGAQPRKQMTGGQIALIIVLAVLLSPVWIGVVVSLFGGGVGILGGLLGVVISFLVVGVVLAVVGVALVIGGIAAMFSAPLGGLALAGGGLIMIAVGLVFVWLLVLLMGMAVPALMRGCVNLCRRLFQRGGKQA